MMIKRLIMVAVLLTLGLMTLHLTQMNMHAIIVNGAILVVLNSLWLIAALLARRDNQVLQQKQSESESLASENKQLFESVFQYTNNGVAILSSDGEIISMNPSFCGMLGYHEADVKGANFNLFVQADNQPNVLMHMQQLREHQLSFYQSEIACIKKNKETVWIMATLSLVEGNDPAAPQFIMQAQNISAQKEAEENLRHMAYHDALTGLPNRNKLDVFLTESIATSRRHHQAFAVLFLDVDQFKNVNDTLGHEAGDTLLQVIADRLRAVVRSTDLVARLGGDEFVVVITDVNQIESVAIIAHKILESVLAMILINDKEVYTTVSIGISVYPDDGHDAETLLQHADLALYRAKEAGRNNYQFYTLEMTGKAKEKMAMQHAMEESLTREEFYLNYQPTMDIKSRKVTGLEALLRWRHPDYGVISTIDVVTLAEESGLIIPVSEQLFKLGTKQLKIWHSSGLTSLTLAINCTPKQLKQSTFSEGLIDALSAAGLPPSCIEIEVTENSIMQDPEPMLRALYSLKDLGMKIVIDDFGTGYWSLSNLRRLSIDKVKIDRSVIKNLITDPTSASIASAIIAMVNRLGIKSVAEGVETREQYEWLYQQGCTEMQGYYLTQPLTDERMTEFLKHPIPDGEVIQREEKVRL